MKKVLFLGLLFFAGYKFYQNDFSFSAKGAFDSDGKPIVVLFVGPGCGEHCGRIRAALRGRAINFQEIDIAGADAAPVENQYGVNTYPTTLIGKHEIVGDDIRRITATLAETYGKEVLSRAENRVMDNHFDADGRAQVVMYATDWCPYCAKQREYFAAHQIPYVEIDVEESETNAMLYNSLEGSGYPLTYVGYRRFSGYQEGEIVAALKDLKKVGPRR